MEEYPGEWITVPAESLENPARTIFVTGRMDVDKFRNNPRFSICINVTMTYQGTDLGMPDNSTSEVLKEATDRLVKTFNSDPVAVMTGIYTGDGQRNWIFYTLSTNIFGRKFNEALSDLPTLPITITAENDSDWANYEEMVETLQ